MEEKSVPSCPVPLRAEHRGAVISTSVAVGRGVSKGPKQDCGGVVWRNGRVLDSGPRGPGFESRHATTFEVMWCNGRVLDSEPRGPGSSSDMPHPLGKALYTTFRT
ncbi:hypothetical protein Bbelb_173630 [Branchiostoma belcheri]|nr:hypothetical protein Bbelb_173630 [Branchiostoma belcheri]